MRSPCYLYTTETEADHRSFQGTLTKPEGFRRRTLRSIKKPYELNTILPEVNTPSATEVYYVRNTRVYTIRTTACFPSGVADSTEPDPNRRRKVQRKRPMHRGDVPMAFLFARRLEQIHSERNPATMAVTGWRKPLFSAPLLMGSRRSLRTQGEPGRRLNVVMSIYIYI